MMLSTPASLRLRSMSWESEWQTTFGGAREKSVMLGGMRKDGRFNEFAHSFDAFIQVYLASENIAVYCRQLMVRMIHIFAVCRRRFCTCELCRRNFAVGDQSSGLKVRHLRQAPSQLR